MTGRVGAIALWATAVIAVVLGAAGLVMAMNRPTVDAPTTAELAAVKADLAAARTELAAAEARLSATGPDSTPVVNAAQLGGLTSDAFQRVPSEGATFSCSALSMGPALPGYEWTVDKFGLHLKGADQGWFNCPVHLPQGATVTSFRAAIRDNSTTGQIVCYLLAFTTEWPEGGSNLAFTPYSGDVSTPGDTMLTDDTIKDPVIDNTKWSYLAECEINGSEQGVLVRAVSIDYRFVVE